MSLTTKTDIETDDLFLSTINRNKLMTEIKETSLLLRVSRIMNLVQILLFISAGEIVTYSKFIDALKETEKILIFTEYRKTRFELLLSIFNSGGWPYTKFHLKELVDLIKDEKKVLVST